MLGADAANRLGIGRPSPQAEILVGDKHFTVIGVLNPVPLAPELDSGVLIGWDVTVDRFGFDGRANTIYTRSRDSQVEAVHAVPAATANPQAPGSVAVSKPSDVLAARRAADTTLEISRIWFLLVDDRLLETSTIVDLDAPPTASSS